MVFESALKVSWNAPLPSEELLLIMWRSSSSEEMSSTEMNCTLPLTNRGHDWRRRFFWSVSNTTRTDAACRSPSASAVELFHARISESKVFSAALADATSLTYCRPAARTLIAPDVDDASKSVATISPGTTTLRLTHSPRIVRISECYVAAASASRFNS